MTFDDVRTITLALPGVEDSTSYGTPALKVGGKLIARLKEDGLSVVILGVDPVERETLIVAFPDIYYVTAHYRDYPSVLVRLAPAEPNSVRPLIERRWRDVAPKRLRKAHDAASGAIASAPDR